MVRDVCYVKGSRSSQKEDNLVWVSGTAIVLSLISFIAIWMYFYSMGEHLEKLQKAHDKKFKAEKPVKLDEAKAELNAT